MSEVSVRSQNAVAHGGTRRETRACRIRQCGHGPARRVRTLPHETAAMACRAVPACDSPCARSCGSTVSNIFGSDTPGQARRLPASSRPVCSQARGAFQPVRREHNIIVVQPRERRAHTQACTLRCVCSCAGAALVPQRERARLASRTPSDASTCAMSNVRGPLCAEAPPPPAVGTPSCVYVLGKRSPGGLVITRFVAEEPPDP